VYRDLRTRGGGAKENNIFVVPRGLRRRTT